MRRENLYPQLPAQIVTALTLTSTLHRGAGGGHIVEAANAIPAFKNFNCGVSHSYSVLFSVRTHTPIVSLTCLRGCKQILILRSLSNVATAWGIMVRRFFKSVERTTKERQVARGNVITCAGAFYLHPPRDWRRLVLRLHETQNGMQFHYR
jgi:hypothetical protein